MFRRNMYHEKTKRESVAKRVSKEYQRFKRSILAHSRLYIYQQTNRILFYCSVAEYFDYNLGNINEEIIERLSDDNNIIAELFKIYQEYEEFQINTWNEIEELIDAYISGIKNSYTNNEKETILR